MNNKIPVFLICVLFLLFSCNTSCLQGVVALDNVKAINLIWDYDFIPQGGVIGFTKDFEPAVQLKMSSIMYRPMAMGNGKLVIPENASLVGDWSSRIFLFNSAYKLEKTIVLDSRLTMPGFSYIIDDDRILLRAHSAGNYLSQFCILNTKNYEVKYFDTKTYSPNGLHPQMISNNKLFIEDCNEGELNPENILSSVKIIDLQTYAVEDAPEFCVNHPYDSFITLVKGEYIYLFYPYLPRIEKWRISDRKFINSIDLLTLKPGLAINRSNAAYGAYGVFQSPTDTGSSILIMFRNLSEVDYSGPEDRNDFMFEIDYDTLTLVKTHDFTRKSFYLDPEFYYDNGRLIFNQNVLEVIDLETRKLLYERNLKECITVSP